MRTPNILRDQYFYKPKYIDECVQIKKDSHKWYTQIEVL